MFITHLFELTELTSCCDMSANRVEMDDASEGESREKSSADASPQVPDVTKPSRTSSFPLMLLQTQPKCELYPELRKIIQVKPMKDDYFFVVLHFGLCYISTRVCVSTRTWD